VGISREDLALGQFAPGDLPGGKFALITAIEGTTGVDILNARN
jgi:hypothetical protein